MQEDLYQQIEIINAFIDEWKRKLSPNTCLYVNKGKREDDYGFFANINVGEMDAFADTNIIGFDSAYELILGDFGFGLNDIKYENQGKTFRIRENWIDIVNSSRYLANEGIGIFVVEPSSMSQKIKTNFVEFLSWNNLYINAVFEPPEGGLLPHTNINPYLIVVSGKETKSVFIAELLNHSQARSVVDAFLSESISDDLKSGIKLDIDEFKGFNSIRIKEQYKKLAQQFSNEKQEILINLSERIIPGKQGEEFDDSPNSVFIPKIGNSPVVASKSELTIKPQNAYQIVLKESVSNKYIASFFKSNLGRLIFESLKTEGVIPHINRNELEQALIILPSPEEQEATVYTQELLTRLKTTFDEFEQELALNPKSAFTIQKQLENTLSSIGLLTEVDKILSMIREGESKTIEFKASLSNNIKNPKPNKDKDLETSALKEIVAFLNTDGGTLLIGVRDDGKLLGINDEMEKFHRGSVDRFKLYWNDLLITRVGKEFFNFINSRTVNIEDKLLLVVQCQKSPIECFLDDGKFYIRTNPAAIELVGRRLTDYIRTHWAETLMEN